MLINTAQEVFLRSGLAAFLTNKALFSVYFYVFANRLHDHKQHSHRQKTSFEFPPAALRSPPFPQP
jgi:low temperature requirement protein LtrA